jgi:hypothetical protein
MPERPSPLQSLTTQSNRLISLEKVTATFPGY